MTKKRTCIIVDSSSGINKDEIKDVFLIPLHITEISKDNKTKDYLDSVDINTLEVMHKIKSNIDLKSSQIALGEIFTVLEDLRNKYDRFVVVPISKEISGSYNTWNMAKDDFPELDILIVDAEDISVGIRNIVLGIKELVAKDASNDEIVSYVEERKKTRYGMLIVKDLSQLEKGGRISKFKAMVATMLGYNILISFSGGLDFYDKTIKFEKAIDLALKGIDEKNNFMSKGIKNAYMFTTFVDEDKNKEIMKEISKKLNHEVSMHYFPAVIAIHVGEGFAIYIESN